MQIQIKNSYTMKKLFLLMALFGVLCAGCSEPNGPIDTPQDPTEKPGNDTGNGDGGTTFITDADGNVVVEAEGGDIVVTVTTNIEYDVVILEDAQAWLSVADTRGELRMEKLTFTVAENDFEERSANVELVDSAGKSLQTIKFTQRAFEKVFESDGEDSYVIEAKGGDIQVNVTTNIEYSVNIPDDAQAWLSVADTRGELRMEKLTFTVAENYAEERSAVVTLLDGDKQELQIINIIQEPAIISCANNEIIYTTKYGYPIELSVTTGFGGNVVSHTYENGYGKIVFDNDVQTIPSSAFKNCNSITTITLPESVTSIESYAFDGCNSLTSVTIPESVISIGKCAFDGCTGELIVNCNIPSASSSSYGAFYNSKFTKVTIGDSVTSIGKYAFYGCTGELIVNCNIPSASDYDEGAFYNSKFTKVTIGDSVTSIGDYAFEDCSSLTSVYYNGDLSDWCNIDFYNGTSNPLYNGAKLYINNTEVTEVTIPSDISEIKKCAFYGCNSLTSVTIPDSVTSIGSNAFSGCTGKLIVNCNIPSASDYDEGAFYNSKFTKVTIGDSVTSIGDYAFYNCSSLACITIPESVISIGKCAFYGCTGELIVNCNIPSGSDYDEGAFYNSKFTKVTIGDSVTSIGDYAFENCSRLTSVTIPDSVTSIGESAFRNCSSLTSITIPDSVTSIGYGVFYGCSNLTSITIPDSVTTIGKGAFSGCKSLTSITIPDSVTSIGDSAFSGCSSLTSITIPESVTTIESRAFSGCSSLTSITIPDSVTSIEYAAFRDCSSLKSITIPDSVTTIREWAFYNCSSLISVYCKSITTPVGGVYMFDGNASGRKIYVPTESVNAYKSAEYWSDYKNYIVGYDF